MPIINSVTHTLNKSAQPVVQFLLNQLATVFLLMKSANELRRKGADTLLLPVSGNNADPNL